MTDRWRIQELTDWWKSGISRGWVNLLPVPNKMLRQKIAQELENGYTTRVCMIRTSALSPPWQTRVPDLPTLSHACPSSLVRLEYPIRFACRTSIIAPHHAALPYPISPILSLKDLLSHSNHHKSSDSLNRPPRPPIPFQIQSPTQFRKRAASRYTTYSSR